MIQYIKNLLKQAEPMVIAQNASLVYLAIITAFFNGATLGRQDH